MPFYLHRRELANAPGPLFNEIDERMTHQVFPLLKWIPEPKVWQRIVIAPNAKFSERHDRRAYLVTASKDAGLLMCEIGLWLDRCFSSETIAHADGRTRNWHTESESLLRFDQRMHIYFHNHTPSRYLCYREITALENI